LLPGNWYWQITNSEGKSPVWSFTIENPIPRNISLVQPNSGSKVSGSGGIVTWTGDSKVSYYKVQISSGGNWNNPEYSFSTVGTQLSINGVSAGSYSLRIGAFSEVSGKWEYTSPVSVSIQ
jgi:hypothetical protein